ncbi:hypothetical protein BGZ54_008805 [Gamsiella multidivaricata]|nr:hypothetical protein BGZ54_008805 [Gamsiella multidivaricata]
MTHLTTDDDSSATASHSIRLQRSRQNSRAGSLPSSPLAGSFLHNGNNSVATLTHGMQNTEIAVDEGQEDGNDALDGHGHGMTGPTTAGGPLQLRVRHFERGASYSGYLTKFSSRTFFSRKQWKRRYFILHQSSLHCFKSSDPQHPLLESLKLCADTIICVTDIFSGKRYCLQITSPGEKNWYVLADTAAEMSGWLRELKAIVLRFRGITIDSRPGTHYSDSSEMSDLSSSSAAMADAAPMPTIPSQYDAFAMFNRSPSPPLRSPHPSQQFDLYQFSTMGSNSLPSRSLTPKSLLLMSGSSSQDESLGQESMERKSSTTSSTQAPTEYASFGTVMEQADALPPEEERSQPFPPLSPPVEPRRNRGSDMAGFAHGVSTATPRSTTGSGRRVSIAIDWPETMITLPRRSSQRLMGSPSRPMSPVSSRPMSPNFNRSSPRSSLVVSPPPRSIHRPSSVTTRHSTQLSPLQIATIGLQSANSSSRPMSPISELSPGLRGSASRAAGARHLRNSSFLELSLASPTGPIQERTYRSPSRPTILTTTSRPMSPTLSSAPTSPLPEPPRSESPFSALKHSLSNGSVHRISIVPRHHDPEQLIKHRPSQTRSRSKSQELTLSAKQIEVPLRVSRANTPSPRLGATNTTGLGEATPPPSPKGPKWLGDAAMNKHMPLMHGSLILPPPPMGQQPEPPVSATSSNVSSPLPSRPASMQLYHKHSLSSSSLRSVSSFSSMTSVSNASHGSAVSRKPSSRDPALCARLATLTPISLGSDSVVPSPPQTALPPIPLPTPPTTTSLAMPEEKEREESSVGTIDSMALVIETTAQLLELASGTKAGDTDKGEEESSIAEVDLVKNQAAGFEIIMEEEDEDEDAERESVVSGEAVAPDNIEEFKDIEESEEKVMAPTLNDETTTEAEKESETVASVVEESKDVKATSLALVVDVDAQMESLSIAAPEKQSSSVKVEELEDEGADKEPELTEQSILAATSAESA